MLFCKYTFKIPEIHCFAHLSPASVSGCVTKTGLQISKENFNDKPNNT